MAKKRTTPVGKRRTREHLIADLAVNHVERQVLLGGGTVERVRSDYGIDLMLFTYNQSGEPDGEPIPIQVKATERLRRLRRSAAATFRIERSDLVIWLRTVLPVILIVYDATVERAYWLHVQAHFDGLPGFSLFTAGETVTVHLDSGQTLETTTVGRLGELRDQTMRPPRRR